MAGGETLRQASGQALPAPVVGASADPKTRPLDHSRLEPDKFAERLLQAMDSDTRDRLERRRGSAKSRGWLVRRLLLGADLIGISLAFMIAESVSGAVDGTGALAPWNEFGIFLITLPLWVVAAKLFGLYDKDEFRTDHSTVDESTRLLLLVTLEAFVLAVVTGYLSANVTRVLVFWLLGVLLVTVGRVLARVVSRRSPAYLQNAVIVGAGDVGQLLARKLLQHPEYGIHLVGFVDREPKERRADLRHLTVVGNPEDLPKVVRALGVERVIVAFSQDTPDETAKLIRSLRGFEVRIDIVPRLFELIGPNVEMHTLEGLPLVGLSPAVLGPSSRLLKRSIDIVGAFIGLIVTAPLFGLVALLIWRDSRRPIFFCQTRLGQDMKEFTVLKFRTMKQGTDDVAHRSAIEGVMSSNAIGGDNGLYKPDRQEAVTRVGAWLRRTSLDELPQLVNILRGEMSLVGPRPSLPYELEHFAPHHFERFHVPPGLTGLWQVTARAHATWLEALEMDVAYVRGWSMGLDMWLICRTPLQMLRLKTR
jgi:exopolysaccharide biosynthesis polyprenyl glycosylphosphotransferase